jgi:hypothetical protein
MNKSNVGNDKNEKTVIPQQTLVERYREKKSSSAPLMKVVLNVKLSPKHSVMDALSLEPMVREWICDEADAPMMYWDGTLILRTGKYLDFHWNEKQRSWESLVELHFTAHLRTDAHNNLPITADSLNEVFRFELPRLLRDELKKEVRITGSEVKQLVHDPGVVKENIGLAVMGSYNVDRVVLKLRNDWSLKTCFLSGEHFYMPGAVGFYYEGDLQKPVSPWLATITGFTIDDAEFLAVCLTLNKGSNLELLKTTKEHASMLHEGWFSVQPTSWDSVEPVDCWPGKVYDLYDMDPPEQWQQEPPNLDQAKEVGSQEKSIEQADIDAFLRKRSDERITE